MPNSEDRMDVHAHQHRDVTEQDLRQPEFRDITDLSELEFDSFGGIARKNRYQTAACAIGNALYGQRLRHRVWFTDTLKEDIVGLIHYVTNFDQFDVPIDTLLADPVQAKAALDYLGAGTHAVELLLTDGSLLTNASLHIDEQGKQYHARFSWREHPIREGVQAFRLSRGALGSGVLAQIQAEDFIATRTLSNEDYQQWVHTQGQGQARPAPHGGFS